MKIMNIIATAIALVETPFGVTGNGGLCDNVRTLALIIAGVYLPGLGWRWPAAQVFDQDVAHAPTCLTLAGHNRRGRMFCPEPTAAPRCVWSELRSCRLRRSASLPLRRRSGDGGCAAGSARVGKACRSGVARHACTATWATCSPVAVANHRQGCDLWASRPATPHTLASAGMTEPRSAMHLRDSAIDHWWPIG